MHPRDLNSRIVIAPVNEGEVANASVYLQDDPAEGTNFLWRRIVSGHNSAITVSAYSEWHRPFLRRLYPREISSHSAEICGGKRCIRTPFSLSRYAIADIKSGEIDAGELSGDNLRLFEPPKTALPGGGAYGKTFGVANPLLKQGTGGERRPVNAAKGGPEIKKRPPSVVHLPFADRAFSRRRPIPRKGALPIRKNRRNLTGKSCPPKILPMTADR